MTFDEILEQILDLLGVRLEYDTVAEFIHTQL